MCNVVSSSLLDNLAAAAIINFIVAISSAPSMAISLIERDCCHFASRHNHRLVKRRADLRLVDQAPIVVLYRGYYTVCVGVG